MTAGPERVVLLNDSSVVRGGATYLGVSLARSLAAAGTPVTFIAGDQGDPDFPPGVDLVTLGERRLMERSPASAALRGLYNGRAAAGVAAWIEENDAPQTVYHLHNWALILSPAVFDALAPVAHRCVVHAHDFFLACPNGAYFDYSQRRVCARTPLSAACLAAQCDKRSYGQKLWRVARQRILRSRLGRFAELAHFVMISEDMRPWLGRALAPRSMSAIPNPTEPFGPPAPAPETQRRLAFIGQIQRLKGVFDIAEAGARLGVPIDFFGDGDARGELMLRYPMHRYHGWRSRSDLADVAPSIRACIVATQSPEPFCLSAFESLATGLPLVVSDSILAAGTLAGSGAAITFRSADVEDLTSCLRRIAEDDDLVARMALAARTRRGRLTSSMDVWVDRHRALYAARLAQNAAAA